MIFWMYGQRQGDRMRSASSATATAFLAMRQASTMAS
jgi:hypothetical protein